MMSNAPINSNVPLTLNTRQIYLEWRTLKILEYVWRIIFLNAPININVSFSVLIKPAGDMRTSGATWSRLWNIKKFVTVSVQGQAGGWKWSFLWVVKIFCKSLGLTNENWHVILIAYFGKIIYFITDNCIHFGNK